MQADVIPLIETYASSRDLASSKHSLTGRARVSVPELNFFC